MEPAAVACTANSSLFHEQPTPLSLHNDHDVSLKGMFARSTHPVTVIDLGFTFVFLAVMFDHSPFRSWIVVGSFPPYVAISAGVTPVFRRRLEKKFDRGAKNQAFLVEGRFLAIFRKIRGKPRSSARTR